MREPVAHDSGRPRASGYNYGLYFRWWDRLTGTEHPDYRRKFESSGTVTMESTSVYAIGRATSLEAAELKSPSTIGFGQGIH
jgi:sterol desaturase/sphingolipid hydroxylase (fatty acid hydroxylase superfamily)